MKAPEKIYIPAKWMNVPSNIFDKEPSGGATEYIRKDIHDETIKTAEDHAYFTGKEKMREKLLEWAKKKYDRAFRLRLKKGDNYAYGQGKVAAYNLLIEKIKSL